jgi:hypothetical protein
MISKKLTTIFALSIPLFILHGIEEIATGFYNHGGWDEFLFAHQLTDAFSAYGAEFIIFQVMMLLLLVVAFLLLLGEHVRFYMLALLGVLYVFEFHHVIRAVLAGGYYPGLVTSLIFPFFAYFFWKEWIRLYAVKP